MKDLTRAALNAQIIQCDCGNLSFGINKADVLSIQRTDRVVLRGDPACPDVGTLLHTLENPDQVVGWLSDGVRQIPIFRLSHADAAGFPPASGVPSPLDQAARVILFVPITPHGDSPTQISSPPWGLLVDRVVGTIEASRKRFHAAPWLVQDGKRAIFRSVLTLEHEVLMLLDAVSANPYREVQQVATGGFQVPEIGKELRSQPLAAQSAGRLNGPSKEKPAARGLVVCSLWEIPGERRVSMGLSISQVPEILESATMIPSPMGSDYVQGLIFWREMPIPVIDISTRLGFPANPDAAPSLASRFIIARHLYSPDGASTQGRPVYAALEAHSAVRILRLPIESQPSNRSLPIQPDMVLGQVELEDETLVIPDLKVVLSLDRR